MDIYFTRETTNVVYCIVATKGSRGDSLQFENAEQEL